MTFYILYRLIWREIFRFNSCLTTLSIITKGGSRSSGDLSLIRVGTVMMIAEQTAKSARKRLISVKKCVIIGNQCRKCMLETEKNTWFLWSRNQQGDIYSADKKNFHARDADP